MIILEVPEEQIAVEFLVDLNVTMRIDIYRRLVLASFSPVDTSSAIPSRRKHGMRSQDHPAAYWNSIDEFGHLPGMHLDRGGILGETGQVADVVIGGRLVGSGSRGRPQCQQGQ